MNTKQWLQSGESALRNASGEPRKLFFVHAAVSVGAMLLVVLIHFLLDMQIDASGGLAGMGMRSILQTVQMLISEVVSFLLPLWEIGAMFVAIRIFRGEQADLRSLSEGFRRFWDILRTMLLEMAVYLVVTMAVVYGLSIAYCFTPFGMQMMEALDPWMTQMTTQEQLLELMQNTEFLQAMMQYMLPVLILSGVVAAGGCGFLAYVLRLMRYLVLDMHAGPWQALKLSAKLTAGYKKELLKLDLHFWWYYLAQILVALILYVPELSALAGVKLPLDAETAYWLCYGIYALCQVALLTLTRPQVEVAFAAAYHALKENQA